MNADEKMLVADDERHIRLFLRGLLKHGGVENIIEAGDGREAMELFRQHQPTVVLLDLNMPKMDGTEVLREIRASGSNAKVVILTARANQSSVEECLANGADAFVRKDASKEEILSVLGRVLEC